MLCMQKKKTKKSFDPFLKYLCTQDTLINSLPIQATRSSPSAFLLPKSDYRRSNLPRKSADPACFVRVERVFLRLSLA